MASNSLEKVSVNAIASPTSESTGSDDDRRGSVLEPKVGELKPGEAQAGGLGRHLGVFSTTFLIIGRIIGTGIFATPSSILAETGSVGASLMLWLLGFALSFAGLCIWLELGCMIPRSGGEKVYLEAVYKGPKLLATTVFAIYSVILGFTAAGCIVFAEYILSAAGKTATEWEKRGIAIAVITAICCAHTIIPRWALRAMNALGVVKVIVLVFIVVTGWVVLAGGVSDRIPDPKSSFHNSFVGSSSAGYNWATALFYCLDSYSGWSNAAYVLNEVKNPVRTLKIAGPLGLGICGVLYMLANVAYFAAATPDEILNSKQTVAALFMSNVFGEAASRAISVFIALSAFANVMTVTFAQARVNQELAKEGALPFAKFWASSWPRGAPGAGLLLHWIPSFIIIVAIPFGDAYEFILDVEGYPGSVIDFFVVLGFFWLRYHEPNLNRPFRCWIPVALFYLAAQVFLIVAPFLRPPGGNGGIGNLPYWLYPVVGIAILVTGAVYWLVWRQILPRIGRYTLEPQHEKLKDGTAVVTWRKEKLL